MIDNKKKMTPPIRQDLKVLVFLLVVSVYGNYNLISEDVLEGRPINTDTIIGICSFSIVIMVLLAVELLARLTNADPKKHSLLRIAAFSVLLIAYFYPLVPILWVVLGWLLIPCCIVPVLLLYLLIRA